MAMRDFGAKSIFKEKGQVEEPTWEDSLAKHKGKGAVGKGRVEEQGRDKERKRSEEQAPGEKQGPGTREGAGRGEAPRPGRGEGRGRDPHPAPALGQSKEKGAVRREVGDRSKRWGRS